MYLRVAKALRGRCPKEFFEFSYQRKIPVINELAEAKTSAEVFFLRSLGYEICPYVCEKCMLPFDSEEDLKRHNKEVHQPNLKKLLDLKEESKEDDNS